MGTLPNGIIRAMYGNPDTGIWEIRNPEKSLSVETEILGFGTWNAPQGIRNPTNESRMQIPHLLESSIWNPKSRTWNKNTRMSLIPLHRTTLFYWEGGRGTGEQEPGRRKGGKGDLYDDGMQERNSKRKDFVYHPVKETNPTTSI